jgi:hypothetical protein
MKFGLLSVCLVVIAAGCATANPRRIATPHPALAERSDLDKNGTPKRQRIPRWVAPPPAYGNRVVLNEWAAGTDSAPSTDAAPGAPEG